MLRTVASLWADRYDRDLTDIFAVQDDVTRRIVDALKITLSPAEKQQLADTETSNVAAYDCELRGREFLLSKDKNRETFEQSIKYFKQALEHDPNYSLAYADLGFSYMFDYQNRWSENPDNSLRIAKEYAGIAIEKDPKQPLARCVAALCALFERHFDRAKSEIEVALSLNPNLALAHSLSGTISCYSAARSKQCPSLSTRCDSIQPSETALAFKENAGKSQERIDILDHCPDIRFDPTNRIDYEQWT
jgi:adenylate cyclase